MTNARPLERIDFGGSRRALFPLALSLLVLLAGLFAVAPVRDAATLADLPDVHLERPLTYLAVAPLSDVLDAVTLLSARQHVAIVLDLLVLWVVWRLHLARRSASSVRAHAYSGVKLLATIALVYAAAVFLPRPMAQLSTADRDLLRIDFHSHTRMSGDARRTFTLAQSREWHRAAGYDVAYVTDHRAITVDGRGDRDDVRLLPGIEADWNDEHVGLIGPVRSIRSVLDVDLRNVDAKRIAATSALGDRGPLLIWNHPHDASLKRLPLSDGSPAAGIRAIEVANGAPHGMDSVRSKRSLIVALAKERNLALTSGTDNHGWGHAAPDWTLLRIAHWRDLPDEALAARIERVVGNGFGATRVVERTSADPGTSEAALAASVVTIPWRMLTTLSADERVMWFAWIWAIALLRKDRRTLQITPAMQPGARLR